MTKEKQIFIVCTDGTNQSVGGSVAILQLGGRKLRAFIHGESLTHYASGRRICDLRPYMILNHKSYRRRNKRADAMLALQDLEQRIGADKAWRIIEAAPVINSN